MSINFEQETAVIYGRLSKDVRTEAQRKDDNVSKGSREMSDKQCLEYTTYKKMNVVGIFGDDDVTGDTFKIPFKERPEGKKVYSLLEKGKVKHLVVAKLDRIGRRAQHVLEITKMLEDKDITLHIMDLGGHEATSSGPSGKLMLTMLAACAEFELENIRSRTRTGLERKRAMGEQACRRVYGWDSVVSDRIKIMPDGKEKKLKLAVENELEQAVIQTMIALRMEGHTLEQIAAVLNSRKIPRKETNKPWIWSTVRQTLWSKHVTEKYGDAHNKVKFIKKDGKEIALEVATSPAPEPVIVPAFVPVPDTLPDHTIDMDVQSHAISTDISLEAVDQPF